MNAGADAASPEAKAALQRRDDARKAISDSAIRYRDSFGGMLFNTANIAWNNELWTAQFARRGGIVHAWGSWRGQSWYQAFGPAEEKQALARFLSGAPAGIVPRVVSGNCTGVFGRENIKPFILAGSYADDSNRSFALRTVFSR
jgi:hypothetical protein